MKIHLSKNQSKLFSFIFVFSVILIANSVYLYITSPQAHVNVLSEQRYQTSTFGAVGTGIIAGEIINNPQKELPQFYQSMLLFHILGGILLVAVVITFVIWHLKTIWIIPNKKAFLYGLLTTLVMILILVSGLYILTEANSAKHQWIFWSHRGLAIMVVLLYIAHRLVSSSAPSKAQIAYGFGVLTIVFVLLVGIHQASAQGPVEDRIENSAEIVDPFIPFHPTNLGEPDSFFFPSPSTTSSGEPLPRRILTQEDISHPELIAQDIEKYGFVVNDSMGASTCARCHEGTVEQWSRSTHRFSSFNNPFYKTSVDRFRELPDGKSRSQWCGACHDPVLMFGGKMHDDIDPLWPESQAGLTCLSCHTIDAVHGKEGNGNYNISDETPSPYLFAEAKGGVGQYLHDMVLKSKPTVHKNLMLKPFFRSSEYCLSCHKVSLDVPINNYRWLRGQNDYDAWHNSGVALNAARTFYQPPVKRSCQDCHMPPEPINAPDVSAKNGMIKSHRFLSVNNALPYIRGDDESVQYVENFVKDTVLIDVFAIRDLSQEGQPIPLSEGAALSAKPGEEIQIDVVVRNYKVGHTFPGGTNDSNESWIHLEILTPDGKPYLESGGLDDGLYVDPEAHFYNVLFVDKHSQPALKRNPQDFHALIYGRVIAPGTANAARYRFTIPKEWPHESIKIRATLNWRKFTRQYTEFVFSHEKLPDLPRFEGKEVPDLPIVQISQSEVTLPVGDSHSNSLPGGEEVDSPPNGEEEASPPSIRGARGDLAPPAGDESSQESEGEESPPLVRGARGDQAYSNNIVTRKHSNDDRPDWMRFNDYGIAHLLAGDLKTAEWAFIQVHNLAPDRVDGLRNQARVALQEGRLHDTYELLRACEDIKAGDPQTAWFWALAKMKEGLYDEAILALKRVIAYYPEDREAWNELGRTYYLNGDYEKSLKSYLEVLKIDPERLTAHYHRMLCYRALGEADKAAEAEKAYRKYQIDESASEVTQQFRLENPGVNQKSEPLHVYSIDPILPISLN